MKIYGLIGRSLGHSFSEKYFAEKFKNENIRDCQYRNFELKDLENGIPELKRNPDLAGLNVTIPYKTEILPFLDDRSAEVAEIDACNCIRIEGGRWKGYNTDIFGFERSFIPHLKPFHTKALILGTGGASKAVAFVLKKLKIDFLKVSRNSSGQDSVISYEDISADLFKKYCVIINTTPLGTFPKIEEAPPLPYELVTGQHYFFDLIYNPSRTRFLSLAEKQGAVIENGSGMLALQAEESWKIWNEKE